MSQRARECTFMSLPVSVPLAHGRTYACTNVRSERAYEHVRIATLHHLHERLQMR